MMTMRQALTRSKNLVSIRILMAIGVDYAQEYIGHFGLAPQHPAYLTMALGAGVVTPLQMAEGYSVFANGGSRVRSYLIDRIEDDQGRVLARTAPTVTRQERRASHRPSNAFIMTSMMKDVVRYGTAVRAMSLGRTDLAGKTGTTNDARDAWFSALTRRWWALPGWVLTITAAWAVAKPAAAAQLLPIWIHYVAQALKGTPEVDVPTPSGIVERALALAPRRCRVLLRGIPEHQPGSGPEQPQQRPQANGGHRGPGHAGRTTPGPDALHASAAGCPGHASPNPAARCGGQGKGAVVLMSAPGRPGSPLTALALIQTHQVCWISADMHQVLAQTKQYFIRGEVPPPKSYVAMQPGPL